MKCLIGMGSNLGERQKQLEKAAQILAQVTRREVRASPIFQTPALVLPGAPAEWHKPYLNAVLEIEWEGAALELLSFLKKTERDLGRGESSRWAPRIIDLDILTWGEKRFESEALRVPHAEAWKRSFVLEPLKHLHPLLQLPGQDRSVLARTRELRQPLPLWMGILNVTPDSFSDGGINQPADAFDARLDEFEKENVQVLDLGAESTRPGASPLTADDEWKRLHPFLARTQSRHEGRIFRPWISVDTYHPEVAKKAVEMGADIINDVSGLKDPAMLKLLQASKCQYVMMHSLTVPADPKHTLEDQDPVQSLKRWAKEKLGILHDAGIDLERVIFDPGIGFGKTVYQARSILRQIDELFELPVRILVGHSRKSFLDPSASRKPRDREWETLGVSLALAEKGVDVLRVHEPQWHSRAFQAFQETRS